MLVLLLCAGSAAAAGPRAQAADVRYGPLKRIGVRAGHATIEGRILRVRVNVRRRTELRLAVVEGDRVRAYVVVTRRRGSYAFAGRLRGRPRRTGRARLRVTARIVGTSRRGRERRRIRFRPARAVNQAPSDVRLVPAGVPENAAAGTLVGAFAAVDRDAGQAHAFSLVPGAGSGDNGLFAVSGRSLVTAAPIDFETKPAASIRVRVTDSSGAAFEKALVVSVGDVNEAPTSLSLSRADVDENLPAGVTVGSLASVDPEVLDPQAFSLVGGAGGEDNALFAIDGTLLKTAAVLDFEAAARRSIRVRVDDGRGGTLERELTIAVNDGPDPVLVTASSGAATYTEQAAPVTVDGALALADQDDTQLIGASVAITGALDPADALAFTPAGAITGSFGAGALTLSGDGTLAEYQAALRSVTFERPGDDPSTARARSASAWTTATASGPARRGGHSGGGQRWPSLTGSGGSVGYTESGPGRWSTRDRRSRSRQREHRARDGGGQRRSVPGEDASTSPTRTGSAACTATRALTLTGVRDQAQYAAALSSVDVSRRARRAVDRRRGL